MAKKPAGKDIPLQVKVEGDQLVIRIGIDTLAFAAEHCERFYDYENKRHREKGPPYIKITNNREFAKETCRALQHEEEDGSTPLGDLLDDAAEFVWGDGSVAIQYVGKPSAD